MVADGIAVPGPTEASRGFSQLARSTLAIGPPALTDEDRDRLRYAISDLLDDLRDPRTPTEQIATGTGLFGALADYYLRVHGFWSGRDKWIPRALEAANPELAVRYAEVFQWFFEDGDTASLIQLTEEILQPAGGPLFDGYRTDAPLDWRASHPAPDALPHESSTAADRPDPQID
jgi:hypothetical protein